MVGPTSPALWTPPNSPVSCTCDEWWWSNTKPTGRERERGTRGTILFALSRFVSGSVISPPSPSFFILFLGGLIQKTEGKFSDACNLYVCHPSWCMHSHAKYMLFFFLSTIFNPFIWFCFNIVSMLNKSRCLSNHISYWLLFISAFTCVFTFNLSRFD